MPELERIIGHFQDSIAVKQRAMAELAPSIATAAEVMVRLPAEWWQNTQLRERRLGG